MILLINKNTAEAYNIAGGLAQLGERLNGIQKVRGSTPLSSTIPHKDLQQNLDVN